MAASNTEQALWYYDCSDPSSTAPQWTEYLDIETDMIEDAHQADSDSVCLNRYRIDLKNFIQIRRDDESKRRSVKRDADMSPRQRIRSHRFNDALPVLTSEQGKTTMMASDSWCPFLMAWLETPLG